MHYLAQKISLLWPLVLFISFFCSGSLLFPTMFPYSLLCVVFFNICSYFVLVVFFVCNWLYYYCLDSTTTTYITTVAEIILPCNYQKRRAFWTPLFSGMYELWPHFSPRLVLSAIVWSIASSSASTLPTVSKFVGWLVGLFSQLNERNFEKNLNHA